MQSLISICLHGTRMPSVPAVNVRPHLIVKTAEYLAASAASKRNVNAIQKAKDAKRAEADRKTLVVLNKVKLGMDTANAIAESMKVDPITVRRKLELLELDGKVKSVGKRRYEKVWVPA